MAAMTRRSRFPTVERIEAEHGRPFAEVMQAFADKAYSIRMTAEELGIPESTLPQLLRRVCPAVRDQFPGRNLGRRRKDAYKAVGEKMRERRARDAIRVEFEGEEIPLAEAARRSGLKYRSLYDRWHRGARGEDLFKPVHPTQGKGKRAYNLGITVREAEVITEYARQRGAMAAHRKFEIPYGAVTALLNDEWHRID